MSFVCDVTMTTAKYFGKREISIGKNTILRQAFVTFGSHWLKVLKKMEGAQAVSINTSETWCKQTAIGTENSKEVHQKIRVLNFHAKIDKQATSIDESSASVLKYRTPNFRY